MEEEIIDGQPETIVSTEVKPTDVREKIIDGIKEDLASAASATDTKPETKSVTSDDIPKEFTEAAYKAGFEEDDVVDFARGRTDDELKELIPLFQEALAEEDEQEQEKPAAEPKTETKETVDLKDQLKAELLKELAPQFEEVERFKQEQKNHRDAMIGQRTNELFDKAAEEFPIFGKTEELATFPVGKLKGQLVPNDPAVKARTEVFSNAKLFLQAGRSIDEAMENALALYKGKHLTKELERNMIKNLNRHSEQLSGPRTSKVLKKTYSDSREEIIDYIQELQRAAGVD